jgi:peroxiredoxin
MDSMGGLSGHWNPLSFWDRGLRRILSGLAMLLLAAVGGDPVSAAEIGARIDGFHLMDTAGNEQSLQAYTGKILVLFFWSFKCPVSLAYAGSIEELQNKYRNQGILVLGVDSAANESAEEIRANAGGLGRTIPILLDPDAEFAGKLGATHTPSIFVLDENAILRYRGAPDRYIFSGERGRVGFLDNVLDALLSHGTISLSVTNVFGCNIKKRGFSE